jgi:hypothetical protein
MAGKAPAGVWTSASAHIARHRALPARIPLSLDQPVSAASGVALLARLLLAALHQVVNSLLGRPQYGRSAWLPKSVSRWTRLLDRLSHRPPTMPVGATDLAHGHALNEGRPPDGLDCLHLYHLLASANHGNAPWQRSAGQGGRVFDDHISARWARPRISRTLARWALGDTRGLRCATPQLGRMASLPPALRPPVSAESASAGAAASGRWPHPCRQWLPP